MLFNLNDTVLLGQEKYRITRFLGGGAIGDVYLATWLGKEPIDVIIKLLRDDYKKIPLQEDREKLLQAVQAEIDTLSLLNVKEDRQWEDAISVSSKILRARQTRLNRKIIVLIDSGIIEDYPYIVQELAPPEFHGFDVIDIHSELKMLRVALALAQAVQLAHSNGIALKDFEPNTKGDRIRGLWLENDELDFKLIDWNINGSTLDEFKLDLVYLGCHLYRLFVGEYLPYGNVHNPMPENLDIYPAWNENLNEGTRLILQGMLSKTSIELYSNIDLVVDDLSWWVDVLAYVVSSENPVQYISVQIKLASDGGQFRRILALAKLALDRFHNILSDSERKNFDDQISFAQKKIEERWRLIIVNAHQAYLMHYYDKAVQEYEQKIKELPPQLSLTKQACLEMLLAQTRSNLSKKTDLLLSHEIEKQIVELFLSGNNWDDALITLAKLPQSDSVERMKKWAEFEISLTETKKQLVNPSKGTNTKSEWLDSERQQIENIDQSLKKSRELTIGLEFLPWVAGELNTLQSIYEQRGERKRLIEKIYNDAAKFQQKFSELNEVTPENSSLEIAIPAVVRKLELAKNLVRNIDEFLQKYSQLRLIKDLGEQTWLAGEINVLRSQQNDVAVMIRVLDERQKLSTEWLSVKPDILALIDRMECSQAGQLFKPFENKLIEINELCEISQKIKKCDDELEVDWIKLRKAVSFLQPINGAYRELNTAREQLENIREQTPVGMGKIRILLASFIENIFPDYNLLKHEPSAENIEVCLNFMARLENTIQTTVKQWNNIDLEWDDNTEWKLLDYEKEWVDKVNGMKSKLTTQNEHEDVWRHVIRKINDRIQEIPAAGERKELALKFHQSDLEELDLKFPLPKNHKWSDANFFYKKEKFPSYGILMPLISYLDVEKGQSKITKQFYEKSMQELGFIYLKLFLNTSLTSAELKNLDVIVTKSKRIFEKTLYNDFEREWESHMQKYGELLYRLQELIIPNLEDAANDSLMSLNAFETSKFNVLFANLLQTYAENAKGAFEEQIDTLMGRLYDLESDILKNLVVVLEGWKAWLVKYGVDIDVEVVIKAIENVTLRRMQEQELREIELHLNKVKNDTIIILLDLEDDNAKTFAKAAQDARELLAGLMEENPFNAPSDAVKDGVHELEEIVRELFKMADLEYDATHLPSRQGSDYHQIIKKLDGEAHEIQTMELLVEKIPERLKRLSGVFQNAIETQVCNLISRLELVGPNYEYSGVIDLDLFKSVFDIQNDGELLQYFPEDFKYQKTKYALINLCEKVFLNMEVENAGDLLDVLARAVNLQDSNKQTLFFDITDAINRLSERVAEVNSGILQNNSNIQTDGVLLSELIDDVKTLFSANEYKLPEFWPDENSALGVLVLCNRRKNDIINNILQVIDMTNPMIDDRNVGEGTVIPVQMLQYINKVRQVETGQPSIYSEIVDRFNRSWNAELNAYKEKIKLEDIYNRIKMDYFSVCKESNRLLGFKMHFIQPVEDLHTLGEVRTILDSIWKTNPKLFPTINEIRDFRNALRLYENGPAKKKWERFELHLFLWPFWLPSGRLQYNWAKITKRALPLRTFDWLKGHWKQILAFIAVFFIVVTCCLLVALPTLKILFAMVRMIAR